MKVKSKWAYPALRVWAKSKKIADDQIDRMIIRARKESLPMWAVEQRENGSWATLTYDTPQNIEVFFKVYQPTMLALARTSQE
jgi:ABC-type transport system involved in cytochrome bd biosynthesis fused ATPase/permease subunit